MLALILLLVVFVSHFNNDVNSVDLSSTYGLNVPYLTLLSGWAVLAPQC